MKTPSWRRWLLLAALFALGLLYIAAFVTFRRDSRNFLDTVAHTQARASAIASPPRALPQQLAFRHGEPAAALLGAGWWPPDKEGASLVRSPARLLLPLPSPRQALVLDFDVSAWVPAPGAVVRLVSAGQEIARWPVGDTPQLRDSRAVLPAALRRDGLVELELHLEGPRDARPGAPLAKPGVEIFLQLRELRIAAVADGQASAAATAVLSP